jgi:hypothetical protein
MFAAYISILFFVHSIYCLKQNTPLDEYVYDDFDIKYVQFRTLSMLYRENVREYKLNITTLKWFNGNLTIKLFLCLI